MNKNPQGSRVFEAMLILLVIGLLILTGWSIWHARANMDKGAPIDPELRAATQNTHLQLPSEWRWYEGSDFKFGYPNVYKDFTVSNANYAESGVQMLWVSGKPPTILFPGLSAGSFVLSKMETMNTPINSRKYGPTIRLVKSAWIVIADNPGDPTPYKTGDVYKEYTASSENSVTVYSFKSGDEGGIIYTFAFTAKGNLYTLELPEFDTGAYGSGQTPNDQKPYDRLASQITETITVQ